MTPRERIARALFVQDAIDAGVARDRAEATWTLCAEDEGDICARDSRRLADAVLSALTSDEAVQEWAAEMQGDLQAAYSPQSDEHSDHLADVARICAEALRAHLTGGAS